MVLTKLFVLMVILAIRFVSGEPEIIGGLEFTRFNETQALLARDVNKMALPAHEKPSNLFHQVLNGNHVCCGVA